MKKFISLFITTIITLSLVVIGGCTLEVEDNKTDNKSEVVDYPDYSKYTDKFDYYGYSSASNGVVRTDGQVTANYGSSLTKEQYQLYSDCGFTIFYPQSVLSVSTDSPKSDWSKLKTEIAVLKEAGITKTLIYDERIATLSVAGKNCAHLVGSTAYPTEEALDSKIKSWISLYANEEGVYGVVLGDEPKYATINQYADVYKSIKRVCEANNYNLKVQFNLNPCTLSEETFNNYFPEVDGADAFTDENCFIRYKKYIKDFLDAMDPDFIQYDDYPLRNGFVKKYYFKNLQFVAEEAKTRGIDFYIVTQSFDMNSGKNHSMRGALSKEEANWLNNTILGYGIKQISYFTYFTRGENSTSGESFLDNGSSFISLDGTPTDFYYIMKEIMGNNQKFAPTIKQFDYQGSKKIQGSTTNYTGDYITFIDDSYNFVSLKSVTVNRETALLTELYDDENKNYMIMAMNIVDPANKDDNTSEVITLEFDTTKYDKVLVYRDGEMTKVSLTNGKIEISAKPGEASYVIPYKTKGV